MKITKLGPEHVPAVAGLHVHHLTGLLHSLGGLAARAYYAGSVLSPHMIGFVAVDRSQVRGFVYGSLAPQALRAEAVARNRIQFTIGTVLGILKRPSTLPYVWQVFHGSAGTQDVGQPELTYIVVGPEARRASIGHQLVDAFSEAVWNAGARSYELSVDRDNDGAQAFYLRLGFKVVRTYREFGVEHVRYRLDLPPKP